MKKYFNEKNEDKNNLRESDKCWRQAKKIQHTDNGISGEENESQS